MSDILCIAVAFASASVAYERLPVVAHIRGGSRLITGVSDGGLVCRYFVIQVFRSTIVFTKCGYPSVILLQSFYWMSGGENPETGLVGDPPTRPKSQWVCLAEGKASKATASPAESGI